MPQIRLETKIEAPIQRVFDLSRSIDLHKQSTSHTHEEAIAGRTSGLIELGETVTWRAKHLGIYQKLTVKIVKMDKPNSFTDVMLKGAFKQMEHTHLFLPEENYTLMVDVFEFESPMGFIGRIFNHLYLTNYMTKFLEIRNKEIKRISESEEWKNLI